MLFSILPLVCTGRFAGPLTAPRPPSDQLQRPLGRLLAPLRRFTRSPPTFPCPKFRTWVRIMPGQALYELRNKHEGADFIALALALQVLHLPRPVASRRQRCATGLRSTLYWDCLASAIAPLGNHRHLTPYLESSSLETASTKSPRGAANSSKKC